MNGHQWRIKRLLVWGIPGLCLLLLILYFVGATLHISPKYDALEAEYKKLNLPGDWVELKQYRQETRDVFGWCQNFTEGPACPGIVTKYKASNLANDPRQLFENLLNDKQYLNIKSSVVCGLPDKSSLATQKVCGTVGYKDEYVFGISIKPEFIGLSQDVTLEVSYGRVDKTK